MALAMSQVAGQVVIRGMVIDEETGDPLIAVNVRVDGTTDGSVTDLNGEFNLITDHTYPITLHVSYVGYDSTTVKIDKTGVYSVVKLNDNIFLKEVLFKVDRVSNTQKESQISTSTMDLLDIRQMASIGFYAGAGNLPEVDKVTASFGFTVINTRGFNSTSPVRTLQLIDGVDNQAPGLNFSLGNFLGVSELDILKMEIIAGAAGAYYGPGAFNGVINMETKNPFIHRGLSGLVRIGERNLLEGSIRYADVIKNKKEFDVFAYKLNLYGLKANDWEAENYEPITDSEVPTSNPGRYNAVNIYGDEYYARNDYQDTTCADEYLYPGLGIFYRHGYKEVDLVEYNTTNYKGNVAFHYRTRPEMKFESPSLIFSSSYGAGTTVYQGENRFSLKDIQFFQNKLEFRKEDKFFIRAYHTYENAGKSYDPYFTALRLQDLSKSKENWSKAYYDFWFVEEHIPDSMYANGYPQVQGVWPQPITFDCDSAQRWLVAYNDSLSYWHSLATMYADTVADPGELMDFLIPGTAIFDSAFQSITTRLNNQNGGTRFYDKSSLFHIAGEYVFTTDAVSEIRMGGSYRLYSPDSQGTIFSDTAGTRIHVEEIGAYTGIAKRFFDKELLASATIRFDKSKNLEWVYSPAASLMYNPSKGNTYFRVSFSSGVRNPTLTDQYQYLNVGPAILAGHTGQVDSLITIESFKEYVQAGNHRQLVYFNVDAIRPERVKTVEVGIRTTLFKSVYADLVYYHNIYRDFLGYLVGISANIDTAAPIASFRNLQVYRYSANTSNIVTTQGFSIGLNYNVLPAISISGNYGYNALRKTVKDDPIIPAYNTPEHKFNIGISGWDLRVTRSPLLRKVGFNVNYKWVQGYRFEGSPQFTGFVPTYGVVDAQVNVFLEKLNTTVKLGAANIFDNKHIETYGGPKVGRHAYISATYNF
jgi:outer membrane receptor protein involved in Fe transport